MGHPFLAWVYDSERELRRDFFLAAVPAILQALEKATGNTLAIILHVHMPILVLGYQTC